MEIKRRSGSASVMVIVRPSDLTKDPFHGDVFDKRSHPPACAVKPIPEESPSVRRIAPHLFRFLFFVRFSLDKLLSAGSFSDRQSAFSFFFPDPTILFSEKKRYGSGSYLKKRKRIYGMENNKHTIYSTLTIGILEKPAENTSCWYFCPGKNPL